MSLHKWHSILGARLRGLNIDHAELDTADYSIFEAGDSPQADMLRLLIQFPGTVKTWAFEKADPSHILLLLFNIIGLMPDI